jgi:hypothetical protein
MSGDLRCLDTVDDGQDLDGPSHPAGVVDAIVADVLHGLAPADLVPQEEPVPAGLLRLACEARDDRRIS